MVEIVEFGLSDCQIHYDDIAKLLYEIIAINLPNQKKSLEEARVLANDLLQYKKNESAIVIAAIENEVLLGFIWAYSYNKSNEKRMHLNHIILKEPYRGLGLGVALLNKLEECARELDCNGIELFASVSNLSAMRFYEKQLFSIERVLFYKVV